MNTQVKNDFTKDCNIWAENTFVEWYELLKTQDVGKTWALSMMP